MKRPVFHAGVGAASILLILVVLCLTTFGVLALLSARADLILTERAFETANAYYQADQLAQQTLSDIDAALAEGRDPAQLPGVSATDGGLRFQLDTGDGRALEVLLALDGAEAPRYTIVSYRLVNTEAWVQTHAPRLVSPAE